MTYRDEVLLIIASCQPCPRYELETQFTGTERQLRNTLHQLKNDGLIFAHAGGRELTDAGSARARELSELKRKQAAEREKLTKVAIENRLPPACLKPVADEKAEQITTLNKLIGFVEPGMARVLEKIRDGIENTQNRNSVNA